MKRTVLLMVVCVMAMVCSAAARDEKDQITLSCKGCHEMDKVCEAPPADSAWWQETVERMLNYKPDLLTEAEVHGVVSILSDPQRRAKVCN